MDASTIIEKLGGTQAVMDLTGLSKGRLSQWRSGDPIPRHWLIVFADRIPELKQELAAAKQAEKGAA